MNKWLLALGALAVLIAAINIFSGLNIMTVSISTVLLAVFGLLVVQKIGLYRLLPLQKKNETIALIAVALVTFMFGGFSIFDLTPASLGFGANLGGGLLPGGNIGQQGLPSGECSVPDEIRGVAATGTVNAYDLESLTPYSAAVDTTAYFVDAAGNVVASSDTTAYSLTGYSVGEVISIYGGSSSYYLDPVENYCIDAAAFPLDLDAHAVVTQSGLQITGYDDTGASGLSAGTNTTCEDYDITIGANGEETFYLKLKQNTAVKAFNLFSVHTAVTNDIDECEPQDADWKLVPTAKFMKGLTLSEDAVSGTTNATNVDFTTWVLSAPKFMTEWESVKYQFNFKASATDPATNADFATSDMAIVCFNDATYDRGSDGKIYLDYYAHTSAESDVGMAGLPTLPVGKQDCTVIEGI